MLLFAGLPATVAGAEDGVCKPVETVIALLLLLLLMLLLLPPDCPDGGGIPIEDSLPSIHKISKHTHRPTPYSLLKIEEMTSSIQNLQLQSLRFPLKCTAKTTLLLLLLLPVTAISEAHFKIKTLVSDGARKMPRIQKILQEQENK